MHRLYYYYTAGDYEVLGFSIPSGSVAADVISDRGAVKFTIAAVA